MGKILIVEDGSFMAAVYRSRLVKAGYELDVAVDGQQAMEKLALSIPDLVVLDLIMPIKDGFNVLKEMKNNSKTKNIPVIVISNLSKDEDIKKAMDLGASDYIVKASMNLDGLVSKINDMLNK